MRTKGQLVLLLLCLVTTYTHAEVFKWVDDDNRTYYSNIPPEADNKPLLLENCDETCLEERNREAKLLRQHLKDWQRWENKVEKIRQKSYYKTGPDMTIMNKTINPTFY